MDALSHGTATFLSPLLNPPAEAIALDGAGWILCTHEDLRRRQRPDRGAEMMIRALEGGRTFQKGLGAVHGLSHALGSPDEPSRHHDTLNAVLLPPVLRFNAGQVGDKCARLAGAIGLRARRRYRGFRGGSQRQDGLPGWLAEIGVAAAKAAMAERDASTAANPRPVEASDCRPILDESPASLTRRRTPRRLVRRLAWPKPSPARATAGAFPR